MSRAILPRRSGIVVRCDSDGCDARFSCGLVLVRNVRKWIKAREDWDRVTSPLVDGRPRMADLCQKHAKAEQERRGARAAAKATRLAKKAEKQQEASP